MGQLLDAARSVRLRVKEATVNIGVEALPGAEPHTWVLHGAYLDWYETVTPDDYLIALNAVYGAACAGQLPADHPLMPNAEVWNSRTLRGRYVSDPNGKVRDLMDRLRAYRAELGPGFTKATFGGGNAARCETALEQFAYWWYRVGQEAQDMDVVHDSRFSQDSPEVSL